MPTLYLLRHAESAPDFACAEADWPLSARGVRQADGFAVAFATLWQRNSNPAPPRLISSPYRRAIATLEPYARRAALPIEVDADLRERHLRDGRIDDWDGVMRELWNDFDARLPNCESGTECRVRITTALIRIARRLDDATSALACSHGNAIALFLNGIDATIGHAFWRGMRNADLFRVRFDDGRWTWDRGFVWADLE